MEGRVMGIYIKGFEPRDGLYVIKDGVIRKYKGKGGTVRPYELVEVKEPHGRLIDAVANQSTIDGTVIITVDDYTKVNRIIVKDESHFGCVFEPVDYDEEVGGTMTREEAIEWLIQIQDKYIHDGDEQFDAKRKEALDMAIEALERTDTHECVDPTHACDLISRNAALALVVKAIHGTDSEEIKDYLFGGLRKELWALPSAQPKRKWTPCSNPPKHHRDVLVRGIEAIGSVNVYKVMQWDVDTWRPTNYASSIMWKEWSEI